MDHYAQVAERHAVLERKGTLCFNDVVYTVVGICMQIEYVRLE